MNTTKLTNTFIIAPGMLVRHSVTGEVNQVTYGPRLYTKQNGETTQLVTLLNCEKVRLDIFWRYWAPLLG